MGRKSRENGNKGEDLVISFFREKKFWVHLTKRSLSGAQPVDIIAVRKDETWLVDAKYVNDNEHLFSFSDIQPNQISSMRYALDFSGIVTSGFAIVFGKDEGTIRFLPFLDYEEMAEDGKKSVAMENLKPISNYVEDLR